jgi:hypothetical protein
MAVTVAAGIEHAPPSSSAKAGEQSATPKATKNPFFIICSLQIRMEDRAVSRDRAIVILGNEI